MRARYNCIETRRLDRETEKTRLLPLFVLVLSPCNCNCKWAQVVVEVVTSPWVAAAPAQGSTTQVVVLSASGPWAAVRAVTGAAGSLPYTAHC